MLGQESKIFATSAKIFSHAPKSPANNAHTFRMAVRLSAHAFLPHKLYATSLVFSVALLK